MAIISMSSLIIALILLFCGSSVEKWIGRLEELIEKPS